MKGNHQARPPQPVISEREKRLIRTLYEDGAFTTISHEDAAQICNMAYPQDNNRNRTGSGVYKHIRKLREQNYIYSMS